MKPHKHHDFRVKDREEQLDRIAGAIKRLDEYGIPKICMLCGAPRTHVGSFFANEKVSREVMGAPEGKERVVLYALCDACKNLPDRNQRVEEHMFANVAKLKNANEIIGEDTPQFDEEMLAREKRIEDMLDKMQDACGGAYVMEAMVAALTYIRALIKHAARNNPNADPSHFRDLDQIAKRHISQALAVWGSNMRWPVFNMDIDTGAGKTRMEEPEP